MSRSRTRPRRRSRGGRGARRGSRTDPRRVADVAEVSTTARSRSRLPARRSSSSRSTRPERTDRSLLAAIALKFDGGPVGLSTLAVALGEEPDTIEDVYEPYLQLGLIQRTPRGRILTSQGRERAGTMESADSLF